MSRGYTNFIITRDTGAENQSSDTSSKSIMSDVKRSLP